MQEFNNHFTVGIIGASGTAYKRTLPALQGSKLCEVIAIQCRDLERGYQIAEEFGIPEVYQSVEELFERSSFDIAYIATPPFRHLEEIKIAANYQKHIICEKPIARNVNETLKIARIIKRCSSKFMIAHHLRHQPAVKTIHKIINDGKIGSVINIWMQWGYQINRNSKNAKWKLDESLSGGGSFIDVGSHCVDIALDIFGIPNSVYSRLMNINLSSVEDYAIAILHYDSADIVINTSFSMARANNSLKLQGTSGIIECHNFCGEKAIKKIDLLSDKKEMVSINLPEVNPYREEVEYFIRSLITKSDPSPSIEDALNNLRIIEAAKLSAINGRSIHIDASKNY